FGQQATEYATGSQRGMWRYLRRLEQQALLGLLQPQKGERILDAGCGAGHYTELLLQAGASTTALDLTEEMVEAVRQRLNVPTISGDLCQIDLAPEFDKILCAGALEFVSDPAEAVAHMA